MHTYIRFNHKHKQICMTLYIYAQMTAYIYIYIYIFIVYTHISMHMLTRADKPLRAVTPLQTTQSTSEGKLGQGLT